MFGKWYKYNFLWCLKTSQNNGTTQERVMYVTLCRVYQNTSTVSFSSSIFKLENIKLHDTLYKMQEYLSIFNNKSHTEYIDYSLYY